MKFLVKINRQFLLTISVLLILSSLLGYFLLQFIINNEIKEDIVRKEAAIIRQLNTNQPFIDLYPYFESKKIPPKKIEPLTYKRIYLMDEVEDETEPYLEYTNSIELDGQWYLIKIRHSLWETDKLLAAIAIPLLVLLILSFVFTFLFTKRLNRIIWQDFEDNLKKIESYSFDHSENLSLENTRIDEFDRLNQSILKMTRKLRDDYLSLREFTENASHEIQTPVSIALVQLEELLQEPLSEPGFKKVLTTITSLKRLSSLMEGLLLLTKIENRQFKAGQRILINTLFKNKVDEYQSLIQTMDIKLDWDIVDEFYLEINQYLAEIFVSNLLLNAIQHNQSRGWIRIIIKSNEIKICNSGSENTLTDKLIFNRFTKEKSNSHGLGLAIVKNICEKHSLVINYLKKENHCFVIQKEH